MRSTLFHGERSDWISVDALTPSGSVDWPGLAAVLRYYRRAAAHGALHAGDLAELRDAERRIAAQRAQAAPQRIGGGR